MTMSPIGRLQSSARMAPSWLQIVLPRRGTCGVAAARRALATRHGSQASGSFLARLEARAAVFMPGRAWPRSLARISQRGSGSQPAGAFAAPVR